VYRDGEFGWTGAGFRPGAVSAGQKNLLFLAGVTMAFAAESQVKVVFVDEVGRLDDDNAKKLLAGWMTMIGRDIISQAILAVAKWRGNADL